MKTWSGYSVFRVPCNKEQAEVSRKKPIVSKGQSCHHSAVKRSQGSPEKVSVQPLPIFNSFNRDSEIHLYTYSLTGEEPRKNCSVLPTTTRSRCSPGFKPGLVLKGRKCYQKAATQSDVYGRGESSGNFASVLLAGARNKELPLHIHTYTHSICLFFKLKSEKSPR